MKQNEIIEMARQAGLHVATDVNWMPIIGLEYAEKLIALARADEREACAKECWKQMGLIPTQAWEVNPYEQCIDAILARGEQA
jgi:hypothetical protein